MYIIFILQCQKSPKQLPKLSKKSRNKSYFNRFWWCPLWNPCLYCYRFLSSLKTWIRYQKTMYLSVTVYNKHLSSRCNLTAQIEQCRMNKGKQF